MGQEGLSSDEVEVCMEKWEEVHRVEGGGGAGGNGSRSGSGAGGKGQWRKDVRILVLVGA
ncbi:hypothetical protein DL98DRAFT_515417 [Cadophora sp. DSE1049]|nr:hypothetical protein DL98DRAFT_515417 [Cadophora sp. DSE1049]